MNMQELELQEAQPLYDDEGGKAVLDLFSSLKWAMVVLCVSIAANVVVQPWFLFFRGNDDACACPDGCAGVGHAL